MGMGGRGWDGDCHGVPETTISCTGVWGMSGVVGFGEWVSGAAGRKEY